MAFGVFKRTLRVLKVDLFVWKGNAFNFDRNMFDFHCKISMQIQNDVFKSV